MPPQNDSRPTLVLLSVTQNSHNYGVRVLLSSAIEVLTDAFPGAEIAALDYGREAAEWEESLPGGPMPEPLTNLRFSWKLHLPNNVFRLLALVLFSWLLPVALRHRLWNGNP